MTASKIVAAAASGVGGAGLDVDEVFSCHLYTGNGSNNRDIVNNIDLSEGGLVWTKNRDNGSYGNNIFDTVRGAAKMLITNSTAAEANEGNTLTQFNNNGFRINDDNNININTEDYVSWTFRKAPKFFDVVTYTGTGSHPRNVSHNLGSAPGMILVKNLGDGTEDWIVYHRGVDSSAPEDYGIFLNLTDSRVNNDAYWGDTAPTSTTFTVGGNITNQSGENFIAYLFAHNNNDGGFGPDGDQDIIKCGSYTGNGSATGPVIDLGFEPQFLMIKKYQTGSGSWEVIDSMRGFTVDNAGDAVIRWNSSGSENTGDALPLGRPTATGFQITTDEGHVNGSGKDYIYMAIRRGPLAAPEDATKVFAIGERGQNSPPPAYQAGFTVDMFTNRSDVTATTQWYTFDRLRGKVQTLFLDDTSSEQAYGGNAYAFDQMQGIGSSTNSDVNNYSWMWKRAPSYFDVVAYSGTGSARTVSHNLSAVPEMMWVKDRGRNQNWAVYHKGNTSEPETDRLRLNEADATVDDNAYWNDTAPTSSVFTVGTDGDVNASGENYIAYLFATVAGVSKVGSYTGNATSDRVIDCGFSNGARFVLIKDTSQNGPNWQVFDTARGITSTKAELLRLNLTNAQIPNGSPTQDYHNLIEPDSSGFKLNHTAALQVNASGINYIFYAIA